MNTKNHALGCLLLGLEILADLFFVVGIILLISGYWESAIVMLLGASYYLVSNIMTRRKAIKNGDISQ